MANYVRFQRGTLAAYQTLLEKGLIDSNTLYFIYDNDDKTSIGSLYMGEKIITTGGNEISFGGSLNDLSDVEVEEASHNYFLVKDETSNKWIGRTPEQVAQIIQNYIELETVEVPEGDNLSIEIIDNIIQLKDFGKEYYAFVPAVVNDDGDIVEQSKYVLTEGFKTGLEAKVEKNSNGEFIVTWYEPNTEALDIINEKINSNSSAIDELENSLISLANKLEGQNGLSQQVTDLTNLVGKPVSEDNLVATGFYKEVADLASALNQKANSADVYTKTDVDRAIAEAVTGNNHLQRKIVGSTEDIDVFAEDAHLYIYMIPTGLQYEDDKYDEYIVIDNALEKIGSWEVNLENYATKDEIIISSVSDDFIIDLDHNKQLHLQQLPISKITDLENILNKKVTAVEGYTLLSPEDQQKLSKLVIDDNNNLGISASVNVDNVIGLEQWISKKSTSVKGLSENNVTDDLFEKLVNSLYITSVDSSQLNVNSGKLSIQQLEQSKVTGLQDALNSKASLSSVQNLQTSVDTLLQELNNCVSKETYNKDLQEIRDSLTWKEM